MWKIFQNEMQKNFAKTLSRNRKKLDISLSYDINDHVYSKSTNFIRISLKLDKILTWSWTDFGLDFWLTTKLDGLWFRVSMVIDVITEWYFVF